MPRKAQKLTGHVAKSTALPKRRTQAPRANAGRKPVDPSKKRDKLISVYFTEAELEKITAAKDRFQPAGAFLRDIILEHV